MTRRIPSGDHFAEYNCGICLRRPQFLAASFFGRDLTLGAKGKGARFDIFAAFDRHGPVERNLVFEDHDLLDVIQQELPLRVEVGASRHVGAVNMPCFRYPSKQGSRHV